MKKVASALGLLISLLLLFSGVICQNEEDADEVTVEAVTDDVPYESPTPSDSARVYFSDHFDNEQRFEQKWVRSQAKKEGIDEDIAKYDGTWAIETPNRDGLRGDLGLVLKTQAKHAAISAPLIKPFVFDTKPLIVQYEVTLQDGQQCGGAYLKLLSKGTNDLKSFHDKTPYTIMFGPDKCGNDYKLHFIFNHRNPLNGSLEEKHCKKSEQRLEDLINDKFPHLYTLILNPDNSFEIHIDNKLVNSGGLLTDFTPEVNPPAEIDDPKDTKPTDWDEREKIPDPEAVKPEDWDDDAPAQIVDETAVMPDGWLSSEPAHIADPSAKKPEDWDSEMDGEWEPPLVDNPACAGAVGCGPWEPPLINNPAFKGKWRAPLVDNPNYKGKWLPRKIPNPDYFEDKTPFKMTTISAVGFELWSMSKDILFDNIIITEELSVAQKWAQDTFEKKRQKIAKDSESVIDKIAEVTAQYPFLWVLYIIIFGIPVVSILYFCFKPADKPKEKMEQKKAAETKKTDEVVEDDKDTVESESQETKDSGEEEEEEDNEEADEEEEVEHSAKENSAPPPETTRKRKVRKE